MTTEEQNHLGASDKFAGIMPGDWFLVDIEGYAGKAIQLGQWLNGDGFDPVQHAAIYVGEGKIVEAMPGGALLSDLSKYSQVTTYWSTGLWPLTDEQRARICDIAEGFVGTPYSAADYFAIAAHRFHVPVPGLKRYIANSKHMICSQLVDTSWSLGGVEMFGDHRWPGYVTPGALYELRKQRVAYDLAMGL